MVSQFELYVIVLWVLSERVKNNESIRNKRLEKKLFDKILE